MDELLYASATTIAQAIREKRVSATEVVEAHLQRIATVNPTLNAVVQVVGPRARMEAMAADQGLARGELRGPPWCPSRTPRWWHGCAPPAPFCWARRTRRS